MKAQTLAHLVLLPSPPQHHFTQPGAGVLDRTLPVSVLLARGWLQGPQEDCASSAGAEPSYMPQPAPLPPRSCPNPADPPTPGWALGPNLSASQSGTSRSQQAWAAPAVHSQRLTRPRKAQLCPQRLFFPSVPPATKWGKSFPAPRDRG